MTGIALAAAGDTQPKKSKAWQATACATFLLQTAPGSGVECGYITVPRRHAQQAGAAISLATVIIKAPGSDRKPDPLFVAQGGPGGSTIDSFAQLLVDSPDERPVTNRDLVLWDQRGTLFSRPALLCPEVTKAQLASAKTAPNVADAREREAYRACGERLRREADDLSAFNTVENANDIEALRAALGYERINFYGVSYGTELGQYLLRQHPQHVRSAVLDAVVPTGFSLITGVPVVERRIALKYFEGCQQDPRCNAAFPNLGPRFLALLDKLDKNPVAISIPLKDDPKHPVVTTLSGADLADALYQALYIAQAEPLIPYVVDRAAKNDFSLLTGLLLPLQLDQNDKDATGMYYTVVCAEHGDDSPDAIAKLNLPPRLARAGKKDAADILRVCREWNIGLLPRSVLAPVKSAVPTLLLSGESDPITPPESAQAVAKSLTHEFTVTFASGAHGQAFDSACANKIIAAFVDAPSVAPDAACAAKPPSRFVTSHDLIVIPQLRAAVAKSGEQGLLAWVLGLVFLVPALALLTTALPVYSVGEVVALLRGRRKTIDLSDADARYAAAAPWLAILALLMFVVTLGALALAIVFAFGKNPLLTFLGAVPSSLRWVFALPLLGIVVVGLMGRATVALWRSHDRSIVARLYYGLLVVSAIGVIVGLWKMGLVTAFFS